MKKIISILVIVTLLATCIIVAIPTSATAVKTYEVDWTAIDYNTYSGSSGSGSLRDSGEYEAMFKVNKTAKVITTNGDGVSSARAYISSSTFAITSETKYEYVFKAKNDNAKLYAGVPFAIEGNNIYMIYGSFNNTSDDYNGSKSEFRFCRASFDWEYPSKSNRTYPALTLDSEGYSTVKVVYDGLNVEVYGLVGTQYQKQGETITLPSGSAVAFGVYSREANDSGNGRTVSVKDAVIYGMNDAAAANMVVKQSNGSSELKSEIAKAKQYPEADYTADSYAPLKAAITAAEAVANDTASAEDVASALATLKSAVDGLKLKEVDKAALEAAIAKAEALKEIEYTPFTFNMVKSAIEEAKALLADTTATQSKLDEMVATIEARIADLKPSGLTSEDEEEEEATDAPTTDAPTTDAPTVGDSTVQIPAYTDNAGAEVAAKKGCGSAVATTAVVLGLVATLGTALVVKKKD